MPKLTAGADLQMPAARYRFWPVRGRNLSIAGIVCLLALAFTITASGVNAASNGIKWYSFDEGMSLGESAGKKIFLHFWAEWCGYCRRMEKKTFQNAAVINYLNKNFIAIKVNFDTDKRLVTMFKVKGLPDNWFFSKDRKDMKHRPGYIPPDKFLAVLKKI